MWSTFSDLGDPALTLPIAFVCAAWLAGTNWRMAARWLAMLAAGMAVVGATKILYAGCGIALRSLDFRVISGHTMLASLAWTVMVVLFCNGAPRAKMTPAIVSGLLLGALVGLGRVYDDTHSVSEVIAGWLLGGSIALCFTRALGKSAIELRRPVAVAVMLLLVLTVAYGHHAHLQTMIQRFSPDLCGFMRSVCKPCDVSRGPLF